MTGMGRVDRGRRHPRPDTGAGRQRIAASPAQSTQRCAQLTPRAKTGQLLVAGSPASSHFAACPSPISMAPKRKSTDAATSQSASQSASQPKSQVPKARITPDDGAPAAKEPAAPALTKEEADQRANKLVRYGGCFHLSLSLSRLLRALATPSLPLTPCSVRLQSSCASTPASRSRARSCGTR